MIHLTRRNILVQFQTHASLETDISKCDFCHFLSFIRWLLLGNCRALDRLILINIYQAEVLEVHFY